MILPLAWGMESFERCASVLRESVGNYVVGKFGELCLQANN
jgi:hypothetical protein